jgi:cytidylate kinase
MIHTPIRVITVEREYGSGGGEFAHDLAESLGWRLLDSELIAGAARIAGVKPEVAAKLDEHLDPWYYRYGKVFWHDPVYASNSLAEGQIFDSERMMGILKQEIVDEAQKGGCVIVGRGAACALAGQPGCFHLFVYATSKAKREWFVKAFPKMAAQADHYLAEHDKRRAAVIRRFYQHDWAARCLYHLQLNSALGTEAMISTVQCAAGMKAAVTAEV